LTDDEGNAALLVVVHGREAVGEPPGVGEDHGAERAAGQLIPHEPESFLARRTEQVERQVVANRDPAEVQGDRGGGLALHALEAVNLRTRRAERLLGTQRPDFGHRADEGCLAGSEPPRNEDLYGDWHACWTTGAVRAGVGHQLPP
jgi:hypothetical protein